MTECRCVRAVEAARTPDLKYEATVGLTNWYLSQKLPRYDAAEQQALTQEPELNAATCVT